MRYRPARRWAPVSFVLAAACMLVSAASGFSVPASRSSLGAQVTLGAPPAWPADPYSALLGGSVSYEYRSRSTPIWFGADAGGIFFFPREAGYGRSEMLTWQVNAGYASVLRFDRRSELAVLPYVGAGMYYRRFVYQDQTFYAARPVIGAGLRFDLRTGRLAIGVAPNLAIFLDNSARFSVGISQRAGVRF